MPIFSLPSNYGIGTLGKAAYDFVDFLEEAKQSYWQILPIGPTSYGDSPYQSFSAYAGNPYFIDLDVLVKEGYLEKKDLKNIKNKNDGNIDYGYLYETRLNVLYKAYENRFSKDKKEFNEFIKDNYELKNYAFFISLKEHFSMKSWLEWPDEDIRRKKPEAVAKYQELLKDRIVFHEYVQFIFFKQFFALKEYMNKKGIKLIGDIPIYVSPDSSDCWMHSNEFCLDENLIPKVVSGVPPDYFNEDGQLWGNPIYDWKKMKANGYKWWIERIGASSKIYDIIRFDHFRGFESYWSVPYGEETAINGQWVKGPGMDLLQKLKEWFPNIEFIAEDLGYHTDEVQAMIDDFGFPGMKVIEFGFDSREESDHSPHLYTQNTVCYVGTHDNSTAIGWLTAADKKDVEFAIKYLGCKDRNEINWDMIRACMSSVSNTFICQIQDYLGLDDSARINIPGTTGHSWKWRLSETKYSKKLINKIKEYTKMYGRC